MKRVDQFFESCVLIVGRSDVEHLCSAFQSKKSIHS